MMKQLQSSMKEANVKLPLNFAQMNINNQKFSTKIRSNVSTNKLLVRDKGFLSKPISDADGRVISIKYIKGHPGYFLANS